MATGSWNHREKIVHLRCRFPVFHSVGENPQREGFCPFNRLRPRLTIHLHSGQGRDLCQPASAQFLFDFQRELA